MRRLFSGGKAPATAPAPSSSSAPPDSVGTSSSAPPPLPDTNPIPMTTRWYITFDGAFPTFMVPLCEALNLSWSIIKNTTEGSSGPADAQRNKFRERFTILFPEDLDGLPDLLEDEPPPDYTDEKTERVMKATRKRNIFDTLSEDLKYLHVRNGLVELFNSLFMCRNLKAVVQVRTPRQDKASVDPSQLRGVEVQLQSVQFEGLEDVEGRLEELSKSGVIWAKYGLWWRKALSQEDNLKRGEWVIWGVWPENLKRISLNPR